MKRVLSLLETFHFVYNSIMKGSPNRIEKIYSVFAIDSVACKDKTQVKALINDKLVEPLRKLLPKEDEFITNFIELEYSKKEAPYNIKTKYVLNKINCYYEKSELFSEDGTIEHIIAETEGKESLNIGNLILLEQKLNQKADTMSYCDKVSIYKKSKYKWVANFVNQHSEWSKEMIKERASNIANIYYNAIVLNAIKGI